MAKRRAAIDAVVPRVSSANATRQVLVKEDGDRDFVDPGHGLVSRIIERKTELGGAAR